MSAQLPPLVSHESLRVIAAAAKVGNVGADVLSFLSASAEYHLLDIVNEASNFCARGKRSRLTVDDVISSLELRWTEGLLVFSGGNTGGRLWADGTKEGGGILASADSKVDLRKIANASLPVCPIEPGFDMHWLAVDGQQPLVPQNPIPSTAKGKGKGTKRARTSGKQMSAAGAVGGEGGKGGSSVQARLSEELTTYLRRCCEAVLSRDTKKRERALASLRNDPGLQQLLPHLCTFIQTKVIEYLKRQKDPDQLAALLQMLQCLLNNPHFAFLEIYLDRLLPPVMSCLLHRDFAGRDEDQYGPSSWSWSTPLALESKWTHWKVRDYAGELLHAICDRHGHTYPSLQARASDMFCTQISRPTTPLTTLYGAITGLSCLGALTVEQTISPKMDTLASRIFRSRKKAEANHNPVDVANANKCLLALIQAAGLTTFSSCETLFGTARTARSRPATSAHANTTTASRLGSEKVINNGETAVVAPNSNIHDDKNIDQSKRKDGFGSSSGSSSGPRSRRKLSSHHQARVRRRLDRSFYPTKTTTPDRLERIKAAEARRTKRAGLGKPPVTAFESDEDAEGGTFRKEGNMLAMSNGSGRKEGDSTSAQVMDVEGSRGGGSAGRGWGLADGGRGAGGKEGREEWGLLELDEVLVPWYVLGLMKEQYGVPQAQWLLDMHKTTF